MLTTALHFGEQFDNFLAESGSIVDSKFAISIAQDTMCWSLVKIVFQDQAISSHLHNMVAKGHGSIKYIELEFHRHRTAIGCLDDVIGLSY